LVFLNNLIKEKIIIIRKIIETKKDEQIYYEFISASNSSKFNQHFKVIFQIKHKVGKSRTKRKTEEVTTAVGLFN